MDIDGPNGLGSSLWNEETALTAKRLKTEERESVGLLNPDHGPAAKQDLEAVSKSGLKIYLNSTSSQPLPEASSAASRKGFEDVHVEGPPNQPPTSSAPNAWHLETVYVGPSNVQHHAKPVIEGSKIHYSTKVDRTTQFPQDSERTLANSTATSPSKLARPSPSPEAAQVSLNRDRYHGDTPIKLICTHSTITKQASLMRFFKQKGGKLVEQVKDCDVLCTGHEGLKRTAKFILAVTMGKCIVIDTWLLDSFKAGHLLRFDKYLPLDAVHEKIWKFELSEALERGRVGTQILIDKEIHFTPTVKTTLGVKTGFKDMSDISRAAGAKSVKGVLPLKAAARSPNVVVIGNGPNDPAVLGLKAQGFTIYAKELITIGILRGILDLQSDDFVFARPTLGKKDVNTRFHPKEVGPPSTVTALGTMKIPNDRAPPVNNKITDPNADLAYSDTPTIGYPAVVKKSRVQRTYGKKRKR